MGHGYVRRRDGPLVRLYDQLLRAYGPQGWWPLPSRAGGCGYDAGGYHPGLYDAPETARARFEVVLGAVLTQNTAWLNAERALANLRSAGVRAPGDLRSVPLRRLESFLRPSGYYRQKALKLKRLAAIFAAPDALTRDGGPSRERLLEQWGVGPETADSILLYAYQRPFFVVDAYTRRLLGRIGILRGGERYEDIQALFHDRLPGQIELYNEYHALIVEHGKRHCRARPFCEGCPVRPCAYRAAAARSP